MQTIAKKRLICLRDKALLGVLLGVRQAPRMTELARQARHTVARTLRALPPDIREHALGIPILFRRIPSAAMCENGDIAPDTLGLFTGTSYAEEVSSDLPIPPQIFLFLGNLWAYAGDWVTFRKEVRITLLHELGHYLNFNEDDLSRRGLE